MISDEEMPKSKSNFRDLLKFFESNSKRNDVSRTPPTRRVRLPSSTVVVSSNRRSSTKIESQVINQFETNSENLPARRASADFLQEERQRNKLDNEHSIDFQAAKTFFESRSSIDSKNSVTSPGSMLVFETQQKSSEMVHSSPERNVCSLDQKNYSAPNTDGFGDNLNIGKKLSRGAPLCCSSKRNNDEKKNSLPMIEPPGFLCKNESQSPPSSPSKCLCIPNNKFPFKFKATAKGLKEQPNYIEPSSTYAIIRRASSSDDIFYKDEKSKQSHDPKRSESPCEIDSERPKSRSFTDRLSIKRSSRKSERRSEAFYQQEDECNGEVLLRDKLKNEEQSYDRRGKYQSVIFKEPAPLYQIYDKSAKRRDSIKALNIDVRSRKLAYMKLISGDGQISLAEEELDEGFNLPEELDSEQPRSSKSMDDSRVSQISSNFQKFTIQGPNKLRWEEMEEVKARNLAADLTQKEMALQNSLFEVITSEASYYHSLSVLINSFYKSEAFDCSKPETSVVTALEKHHLFSNILEIHAKSEKFLQDLEEFWLRNPMLTDLPSIIYNHGENNFAVYITYVKNQPFQIKTLEKLRDSQRFNEALKIIRKNPETNFMDLHSFLLMPFQRVTRIRLLLLNTLSNCKQDSHIYNDALMALAVFDKILEDCQSQTLLMSQKERIAHLSNNLEYKSHVKTVSVGDKILKEGELKVQDIGRAASPAFKAKLWSKPTATLFLSKEFLLITRRKSNGRYSVEDVCSKKSIELDRPTLPENAIPVVKKHDAHSPDMVNGNHDASFSAPQNSSSHSVNTMLSEVVWPFRMTAEGSKGKVVYVFVARSISERERWMDALSPNFRCGDPKNFETPDCMQVYVSKPHPATECDELNLKSGDLVNILIALPDGWYKGILPGRKTGWFSAKDTIIVEDEEVRRKNMENFKLGDKAQRYYEEQMKKKSMIFMDEDDSA